MTDVNIQITIPNELRDHIIRNVDHQELESSRIQLNGYKGRRNSLEQSGEKAIDRQELYQLMGKNFRWLLDYLGNENPYMNPVSQFESKIGHMLGVTTDYLSDVVCIGKAPVFITDMDDLVEENSLHKDLYKLRSSNEQSGHPPKKVKTAISAQDDFNHFDISQFAVNQKMFDNLRKILEAAPKRVDYRDTMMYQYMKPRCGPLVDTTPVEKKMFAGPIDRTEAKILKRVFEKSSMEDFVKLIKLFSKKCTTIEKETLRSMPLWKAWLLNGFHLVLCGDGSKRNVLNAFCNIALRDGPNLTINAHTVKGSDSYLWNYIHSKVVGTKWVSKAQAIKSVANTVEALNCNFYVVIYGIDSFMINEGFTTLKALIELKNVKVVGDINHRNVGAILYELDRILGKYRLVSLDTREDYGQELFSIWQNNPPSLLVNKKAQRSPEQIKTILEALSQNHQRLFTLMAQMQLEQVQENRKFLGIEKNSILHDPRAVTLCHNESKLDNLLTEFTTHDVIEQNRGPGGRLFLRIPFETHQLEYFVH